MKEVLDVLYDAWIKSEKFATELNEMLSDDIELMWDYVKVGRQFWDYDEITNTYELITITYKRSGVAFYKRDGDDSERYFLRGSIHLGLLYPRIVYAEDLRAFARKHFLNEEGMMHMLTNAKPYIPSEEVQIDVEF